MASFSSVLSYLMFLCVYADIDQSYFVASNNGGENFGHEQDLSVLWGLADEATVLGKLFYFPIPSDAFRGSVDSFEVTEAGFPRLPEWLSWDVDSSVLYGVPMGSDLDSYFIQVVAKRKLNNTHFAVAQDVFTLHVSSETYLTAQLAAHQHESFNADDLSDFYSLADLNCERDQPLLVIRLILGVFNVTKLDELKSNARRSVLEMAAKRLQVPIEQLRLATEEDLPTNVDLILAGPGRDYQVADSQSQDYFKLYLSYRIGCGTNILPNMAKLISRAEQVADKGLQCDQLSLALLKWEVINVSFGPRRRSRLVGYSTPTPVIHQTTPTAAAEGRTTIENLSTTWPTSKRTRPTVSRTPEPAAMEPTTWPFSAGQTSFEETPDLPITNEKAPATTGRRTTTYRPTTLNSKPQKVLEIDEIHCTKGIFCSHAIEKSHFIDTEDGGAHQLRLVLTSIEDSSNVPQSDWLRYNAEEKTLEGISLHIGSFQYRLAAYDRWNSTASDAFVVKVVNSKEIEKRLTHSFQIRLLDDQLYRNSSQLLSFVRIVSKFCKDSTPSNMAILDVQSRQISWTNISLLSDKECPEQKIRRLAKHLSANGKILKSQLRGLLLGSGLNVTEDFSNTFKHLCNPSQSADTTTKPRDLEQTTINGTVRISILADDAGKENPFVATVLPIIIIVTLLILAAIIACLLYRRNRDRKGLRDADGKNLFVSKGVPIILPDEIEPSLGEPTAASPMLLKDEKPPATFLSGGKTGSNGPTSVRGETDTTSAEGKSSTPEKIAEDLEMSERGRQLDSRGAAEGFELAPSTAATRGGTTSGVPREIYRPPPPFETSTASPKPRPTHQNPQQRQPPPYVPP